MGPPTIVEGSYLAKRSGISSKKSPKSSMCDSMNKPEMSVKKSSSEARTGRHSVPYYVEVHEFVTVAIDEEFSSKRR